MEELIYYTDDKLNNLDKNILVDTLKHTSDIMTALSNKVYIMEEEIKNIQEQLLSLSNENKLLKESLKNNNFDKLYKVNQNINITYDNDNQKNDDNQNKETKDTVNKILEIKKEEVSGNIVNNRKKNNLFIRKI
jgi:hypothetical protein